MKDHHAALIQTMFLVSAADADITDAEVGIIGDIVGHLPVFRDYDESKLAATLAAGEELLTHDNGIEEGLKAIKLGLPPKLRETAYALACDVAAADAEISQEALRFIELLREELSIDTLVAAAIERGARARFRVP